MTIDAIATIGTLPIPNRAQVTDVPPEQAMLYLVDYLVLLVRHLQSDLVDPLTQIMNLVLQLVNVGVFYFQLPDANGSYKDGDVRLIKVSGGSIELQENDGTDWRSGSDATAKWDY